MDGVDIPFSRRVIAYAWDSFFLTLFGIISLSGARVLDFQVSQSRILSFLAVLLCYEPVLVYFRGGTFGHRLENLKVIDKDSLERPGLLQAFVRAVLKYVLGFVSVIWMCVSKDKYLLHDYLSRTRVTLRDESEIPLGLRELAGNVTQEGFLYPSLKRRMFCLLFYWGLVSGAVVAAFISFNPKSCLEGDSCNDVDLIFIVCALALWLSLSVLTGIQTLRARLWGARRVAYKITVQS